MEVLQKGAGCVAVYKRDSLDSDVVMIMPSRVVSGSQDLGQGKGQSLRLWLCLGQAYFWPRLNMCFGDELQDFYILPANPEAVSTCIEDT